MTKMDVKRLEALLKYWIAHNEEHAGEFQEWADKAKASGNIAIHDSMSIAVRKIYEANEYLLKALKELNQDSENLLT
ncbi:TPA: hypothetical protein ENG04_04335 [Candidatus Poribacteria bacterium]|nr:hypothetical protein [Candidatus Poribacteria bacterium]HEX29288.1 hypothetical protein [Candidatus Poribacteria bacterium]